MTVVPREASLAGLPAEAGDATWRTRLRCRARTIRGAWLQILGAPDYERYLAHMAAQHPGTPVLTRRAFVARALDRKGDSGPRCC